MSLTDENVRVILATVKGKTGPIALPAEVLAELCERWLDPPCRSCGMLDCECDEYD